MVCSLLVALVLVYFLAETYRSDKAMTQRERYCMLAFVCCALLVLDAAMLDMPSVAWRFAGYFAMVVTIIACLATLVHVRRNPANMRRVLMFTQNQLCIGHDGNLYLRTYDKHGAPEFTLIATYP